MSSSYVNEQLPSTAQDYIRRFDERWIGQQQIDAQDSEWMSLLVEEVPLDTPVVRFPLTSWSIRYVETRADNRDQDFTDRFFDLKVVEFDAGVEEQLMRLNQYPHLRRQWDEAPARFKSEEREHAAENLAALLESNPAPAVVAESVDGVALFSTAHPTASGTTWSNYNATGGAVTDLANIQTEAVAFKPRGPDGRLLRAKADFIMVPSGLAIPLANLMGQALIATAAGTATQSNPYFQGMKIVENPYLTDANDWYIGSTALLQRGYKPLIGATFDAGPDLGLRRFDESSDHFKSTGRIKVSSHIYKGFGVAFGQALRKVKVA